MDPLLRYLRNEQNDMVTMLRRFVNAESPSTDKAPLDRFAAMVGEVARSINGHVRYYHSQDTGDHLRAEFRLPSGRTAGRILLLGHLDTVWNLGTIDHMPFRIKRGRAYGPGALDMKSGIVIGLFALQALQALRIPVKRRIVLLLTADEESGSPSSRPIIEREARQSEFVLALEPAHGPRGALKTARKGVGEFQIRAKGRAAHAGLDPEKGASAIGELCRQMLRLEKWAEPRRGITLNVGVVWGGTRSNVVPAEAAAKVDVRVARAQDGEKIEKRLRSIKPFDRRVALEITGRFTRPPLERTAPVADLFRRARRLARSLGISLQEASVGGGSDGNFTAALGIPTLDGLGGVGDGAHAAHENILIPELPRRSALLAHLIAGL